MSCCCCCRFGDLMLFMGMGGEWSMLEWAVLLLLLLLLL
jgi:hypothetical protein